MEDARSLQKQKIETSGSVPGVMQDAYHLEIRFLKLARETRAVGKTMLYRHAAKVSSIAPEAVFVRCERLRDLDVFVWSVCDEFRRAGRGDMRRTVAPRETIASQRDHRNTLPH